MLTRAADIPKRQFTGYDIRFLVTPETGAVETMVVRGRISAGFGNRPHFHDREEILVVLSGTARYELGDESGEVSDGDVIVVPLGVIHGLVSISDLDMISARPAATRSFAPDGAEIDA
jgi:quercetin dioxygenase-like cupin family protein